MAGLTQEFWPYTTSQLPHRHTPFIFLIVHGNVTLNIVISHKSMQVSMEIIFPWRKIGEFPDGLLFIMFGVSNCINCPVQFQRIQSHKLFNSKQFIDFDKQCAQFYVCSYWYRILYNLHGILYNVYIVLYTLYRIL